MPPEPILPIRPAPDHAPTDPVEEPPAPEAAGHEARAAAAEALEALLTPREAAKLLKVSDSWLWQNTAPRGAGVPCLKLGRAVRYAPADLREFLGRLRREAN